MNSLQQRQSLLPLIEEASTAGARLHKACGQIGLSVRTVQRWRLPSAEQGDRRVAELRTATTPSNKLSQAERQTALDALNSEDFKDLPPTQIVPRLADQGRYVGSESTLYRLLREEHQIAHRRAERPAQAAQKPRPLLASQPDQIYCWDITYLPTLIRGVYFYLYLFMDLFSRKIVGWQVFDRESAELASQLLQDICERQNISVNQLTVHSDNGSPMKGETMLAMMQRLGVAASRSRPAVSNDNPFSEAAFKTLKYRPDLPVRPFEDLLHARRWATDLVHWYNDQHRHSAIRFVTPSQRHEGLDREILEQRKKVYQDAKQAHPDRWSGPIRNWSHIDQVHLNPAKSSSISEPQIQAAA